MRNWVTVLLPVAAALALASCAGFAPAASRAAELYDMDSYLIARGRLAAASAASIAMPLPPVTDSVDTAPPPAGGAVSDAAAAAISPNLPQGSGLLEVGIEIPPRTATPAMAVALPAPVPPPAPASAARTTTPAPAIAALAAPASGASKPAATATAVPAASATVTASAAAAATKKVREVYARVGDEIEIGLDGVGFLFLGFADRQTDSMTFKARTVKDGKTFFTFKALKLGTWDLDFQQQDNTTGATRVEGVRVVVLEEADFAAAVQRQTAPGREAAPADVETGRMEWAEKLAALGKETAAIAEYLKGYREGNPELNDRIATLYTRTGDGAAAEKYWLKNVGAASPWGDRAVVGIARLAVARGDLDGYLKWHRQLLAVSAEPIDDVLVDAALAARAKGDVGLGIDLLSEYGRRYPEGRRMDEAAFVTAGLLETDSQFRDLKRSRDLYAALLREFPESVHADEALERLRYLEQHFFTIR
jgi:TolA-binding protein